MNEQITLRCTTCGETKPLKDFHRSATLKRAYQYDCKVCALARRQARYHADPTMRERQRETSRRRNQKFRDANGTAWRAGMLNQKAKKFGVPGRVTIEELRARWDECGGLCVLRGLDCLGEATEWDHAIPLTRFGATGLIDNLLPACRSCNARKNNLTLLEWRRECRYRLGQESGWIHPLALVGEPPESRDHWGKPGVEPYIAESAMVEAFATVDAGTERATTVGANTWLGKHVHLGHDVIVGADCELAPHVCIGGWVEIGDNVKIGVGACVRPRIKIGNGARLGAGSVVVKDVPAGQLWAGNPARPMHDYVSEPDIDPWMEWYDSWHEPNEARDYYENLAH